MFNVDPTDALKTLTDDKECGEYKSITEDSLAGIGMVTGATPKPILRPLKVIPPLEIDLYVFL